MSSLTVCRSHVIRLAVLVSVLSLNAVAVATAQTSAGPQCQPSGALARIAELPEASGVAVSRRSPGRLWAHNDSGAPDLVALDVQGTVAGRVRVDGAKVEDWEALSIGACPAGTCLYVADIGDNEAGRRSITIYRVPEPDGTAGPLAVGDVFNAAYPDGPQDAEALLVTPKGDVFVVTKGERGAVALFRLPREAKPGATVKLQLVGRRPQSGGTSKAERITDGAVSPDGAWVALRTNTAVLFHRAEDLFAGNWREAGRVSLEKLGEPQGEGIAFGDQRTVYLVGEGGGKSQPGTFARLACTF